MANNDNEKPDILEDIKKIDRAVRAKTLANVLSQLKEKAHEVLVLKEETVYMLEAVGVSEADIKRIIDFVNSLDDVQLSDTEKRDLKEQAKDAVSEVKKKAEKKVNEAPTITSGFVNVPHVQTAGASGPWGYATYTGNTTHTVGYNVANNMVSLTSGSSTLKLKA